MFESFEELEDAINNCEKCGLCKNRKNVVIGYGNKNADIMIVGEGPSSEDDIQGIIAERLATIAAQQQTEQTEPDSTETTDE